MKKEFGEFFYSSLNLFTLPPFSSYLPIRDVAVAVAVVMAEPMDLMDAMTVGARRPRPRRQGPGCTAGEDGGRGGRSRVACDRTECKTAPRPAGPRRETRERAHDGRPSTATGADVFTLPRKV